MKSHTLKIRPRFGETDGASVIYHANYFSYLEDVRMSFLDSIGLPYKTIVSLGYHMPIVEASIRYRAPAFFGDELEVIACFHPMEGPRLVVDYEIKRGGEVITEAKTTLAFINQKGFPVKPPAEFVEKVSKN